MKILGTKLTSKYFNLFLMTLQGFKNPDNISDLRLIIISLKASKNKFTKLFNKMYYLLVHVANTWIFFHFAN